MEEKYTDSYLLIKSAKNILMQKINKKQRVHIISLRLFLKNVLK